MAAKVTRARVADLIAAGDLVINDGYRAKNSELSSNGLPFARAQNINNGFRFDNADRFPEEHLARVGAKVSREGDVVFTSKGTVGRFAFVRSGTPRFLYSPQLCFWRSVNRDRIDPRWLSYWMQSREFLVQYSGVAGQTDMAEYVSLRDQRRMSITLPSLYQQRAIAHILGTLDDKIELNRRMNETLEEMARAIFKSWFVDFDPVRAKAEGRDPDLPKHIADLFPDRFEDSELGEIPAGWSAGKVDEDFDVTMGQSPPGNTYNEAGDGLPFYQGRRDFGFRYPALRVYCNAPKRTAQSGDALVSVRAPVGDVNMAEVSCCIGRGVAAVRHKTGSRSYTYYAMQALKAYFDQFESDGTVFGSISKSGFAAIPFLIPASKLVESFESVAFLIDQLIEINEKQTRSLTALRDALLPRLISGELRVGEAEELVEELL